ncbi:MAG: sulfite exporter TauE/SafE family protein [Lewinellaceae bacterium]|nr:sulfite exporter TauE/SafE family protein [Saprospiraceae bacterium]MCB9312178.1 sulfite exporter TauE/SafE family protein [Lewinellaceae bacterium]HRW76185.1 sulfite exporter TauE/SafE family protein [Saprospiraceae bacterium]
MDPGLLFYLILLVVAFFYASVGHGGASGYLAVMALFGLAPEVMRPSALVLNVIVSSLAFYQYSRRGYFRMSLFLPFAVGSIPASFIGGTIVVDPGIYKQILGGLLVVAVLRMLWEIRQKQIPFRDVQWIWAILIGAGIGLFSGMIGIGGGIILSPVILLLHWANMKETAAVSALFILVNSLAGLAGLMTADLQLDTRLVWMILAAFGGGMAGSYLGARRLGSTWLRYVLAAVLLIAAVKLILI